MQFRDGQYLFSATDLAEAGGSVDDKVARTTLDAMAAGADVVFQATLRDGQLFGHADFLMRVDEDLR